MTQSDHNCFDDYTDRALDAILHGARVERDLLQWLLSVLAAVAAELKSSAVLTVERPGSWKSGPDHQLVGGNVTFAMSASHMTTTRMSNGVHLDTAVGTFAAETHLIAYAPRCAIGRRARRIERPRAATIARNDRQLRGWRRHEGCHSHRRDSVEPDRGEPA